MNVEILSNITMFVFVIGMVVYGCYETRRQDREFAEWQKETGKKI